MSARHVAQTTVGMNRLMNPFDPVDPSILRAIEEMQRVSWSLLGNSFFEPPRVFRRLHFLRGLGHGKTEQILTRG